MAYNNSCTAVIAPPDLSHSPTLPRKPLLPPPPPILFASAIGNAQINREDGFIYRDVRGEGKKVGDSQEIKVVGRVM